MPIRIFNNIPSLNAQRILGINNDRLATSVERISSGLRINRAADDAAGLAISVALRSDLRALRQAAKGTVGSTERQTIQLEFDALRLEIDRIANTTEFNGQKLVDGSLASTVSSTSQIFIQVGLDSGVNSRINLNEQVNLAAVTASSLGISDLSVTTAGAALTTLDQMDASLASVTQGRGKVGAMQNRLVRTVSNLSITIENLQAAESAIRDADIAEEVALLTRNQILVQAATAMVGQANLIPQSVLQLLQ